MTREVRATNFTMTEMASEAKMKTKVTINLDYHEPLNRDWTLQNMASKNRNVGYNTQYSQMSVGSMRSKTSTA